MEAEQNYLFRHALVRDAAYELQLPRERASLHETAADVLEAVYASALQPVAHEIADHLNASGHQLERQRRFTDMAARYALDNHNHDEVVRLYRRLIEIGEPKQQIEAHQLLYGTLRAFRNDVVGAREHAFALWRLGRREGHVAAECTALNYLAGLEEPDRAKRLLRRSFRLARSSGAWMPAAIAIGNLGAIYREAGDLRRARRFIGRSIQIHRRSDHPVGEGFFLCALAGILHSEGDYEASLVAGRRGVEILEGLNARRYLATAYGHLATALDALKRFEESESVLATAEKLATDIQLHRELWKIQVHRALVALERERPEQALELWGRIRRRLTDSAQFDDLKVARSDLQKAGVRLKLLPPEAWLSE